MKIGRNDPCHCGSGKKHKNCCLDKPDPLADLLMADIRRQAISTLSDHAHSRIGIAELDAAALLGFIQHYNERQKPKDERYYEALDRMLAFSSDPEAGAVVEYPSLFVEAVETCAFAERYDQALSYCERFTAYAKAHADAELVRISRCLHGDTLMMAGRVDEGLAIWEPILAGRPTDIWLRNQLAIAADAAEQPTIALKYSNEAISLVPPEDPEGLLGQLSEIRNRSLEAIVSRSG